MFVYNQDGVKQNYQHPSVKAGPVSPISDDCPDGPNCKKGVTEYYSSSSSGNKKYMWIILIILASAVIVYAGYKLYKNKNNSPKMNYGKWHFSMY